MKIQVAALLAFGIFTLSACGAAPTSAPETSAESTSASSASASSSVSAPSAPAEPFSAPEASAASEASSAPEADVALQRVGTAEFGYVDIPTTWVRFVDTAGGTDLQYTDGSGVNIITMNLFVMDGLTEEQKALTTAETAAQSVWYNLENGPDSPQIQGATVKFRGFDAFQVYALYDDGSALVTWSFEGPDGKLHYIAAEGTTESIFTSMAYLENSWSMEEQPEA